jgi:ADP-heptose:LPS heptosyltransferase/GT2 family glycosyltransferase
MNPLYTISIAVHNNLQYTKDCIVQLFATVPPDQTEIIVFNNASTDGTAEYFKTIAGKRPGSSDVGVLNWSENIGFGAAHNHTLSYARGTYFLILNNDIRIPAGLLPAMRDRFLKNPKLGLCGVAKTCSELDTKGYGVGAEKLEYLEASCLMIPTWLAKEYGLFDTKAFPFAYCEDTDLALRLRQRGYELDRVDIDGFIHLGARTTELVKGYKDLDGIHKRNHVVLARKWQGYLAKRRFDRRVVLVRNGAMGDVILVEPVIRAIKQQNAHTHVTMISACGEAAFRDNPHVDEFFPALSSAPAGGVNRDDLFDLNMAYEKTPEMHICTAYAKACGVPLFDYRPRIYLRKQDRDWADQMLAAKKKWVALHAGPCPGWPGRNLEIKKWAEVSTALRKVGLAVALVGRLTANAPGAVPIPFDLNLQGKTNFHQLAAVIERCAAFTGVDSMPMHLAVAFERPLACVFGCIDPRYRIPALPFMKGVQADVGCLGCHHIMPPPRVDGHCFRNRPFCMERIEPQQIVQSVLSVMEAKMPYLETSKIRSRAMAYCNGNGIDIGCKDDKIRPEALGFDKDMHPGHVNVLGDAAHIEGQFAANTFDYVYSSHCLEDLVDTRDALRQWLKILKPGGHLILYVPHPTLYKGRNIEHKHPGFTPEELVFLLTGMRCERIEAAVDDGPDRYSSFVVVRKIN